MDGTVLAASGGALALYMVAVWAVSVALRDVSIVDVAWGPGFVVVAWVAYGVGDGAQGRRLLLAGMVTVWGVRLAAHLPARKLAERREDPRYSPLRERGGRHFWLLSLVVVFLFQGVLMGTVSLPVQVAAARPAGLGLLDAVGVAVWAVGVGFESIGDEQLRRFKADPANRGRVMDRGLWRWTRHPNYFGDFLVWWGVYLVALAAGGTWWTVVGPLVMSALLIRVSGLRLLEARLGDRPGYADYVRRTSGFVPRPRRGSSR